LNDSQICQFSRLSFHKQVLSNNQAGPTTLFAPVNSAFEDDDELAFLLAADPEVLTTILEYHLFSTNVSVKDRHVILGAANIDDGGELLPLGANLVIDFSSSNDTTTINGATFLEADILADNGVFHKIIRVLGPGGSS
jgi:uncharacterized surface protein with fasciclin (FAS1) repeats